MTGRPTCYLSGTLIRGAHGDVLIEEIEPGDDVVVRRDGEDRLEPVTWVGHTSVDLSRHAHVEDAAPIRIRANAIAEGHPVRDLVVSPEHSLILGGFCVPAKLLVNGGSIISERNHAPFTYYHIELERHGALIAENTLAESYLDTGNRMMFDNGPGPQQLHPTFKVNENAQRWKTDACAPLIMNIEDIEAIWMRLAERSATIGYPVTRPVFDGDADIRLIADGRVVRPISHRNDRLVFAVPAKVSSVVLASRYCIPADRMIASLRDTRRLGLRVHRIEIDNGTVEHILCADDPALKAGWHPVERDASAVWRWTDGEAEIPWQVTDESAIVTVYAQAVDEYPEYEEQERRVA